MNHVIWIFRYPNFGFPCNISHMFLELGSVRKSGNIYFPRFAFFREIFQFDYTFGRYRPMRSNHFD